METVQYSIWLGTQGGRLSSSSSFLILCGGSEKEIRDGGCGPPWGSADCSQPPPVCRCGEASTSGETGAGKLPVEGLAVHTERPRKGSKLSGNCSLPPWL